MEQVLPLMATGKHYELTPPTPDEMEAARAWARRKIGYDPPWNEREIAYWFNTPVGRKLREQMRKHP